MSQQIIVLLDNIEYELKQLSLWSAFAPPAEAFNSTVPFCYDSMALQDWLQFILLPRLRAMIDAGVALPNKISVLPVAEQAFNAVANNQPLLDAIAKLDETLSAP